MAMDLCRAINFEERSPESNLKKQEQQLLFYVAAKRGETRTDKVVNTILKLLGMEQRQDDIKTGLSSLKDFFIARG